MSFPRCNFDRHFDQIDLSISQCKEKELRHYTTLKQEANRNHQRCASCEISQMKKNKITFIVVVSLDRLFHSQLQRTFSNPFNLQRRLNSHCMKDELANQIHHREDKKRQNETKESKNCWHVVSVKYNGANALQRGVNKRWAFLKLLRILLPLHAKRSLDAFYSTNQMKTTTKNRCTFANRPQKPLTASKTCVPNHFESCALPVTNIRNYIVQFVSLSSRCLFDTRQTIVNRRAFVASSVLFIY